MATALELIEKQENYYKELQRLSDPNSYFEDHPDLKEAVEDILNALPELYTDPSLLKNYDSDFAEELLFLVVYLPLSTMFDFYMVEKGASNIGIMSYDEEDEALARRLRSKLGAPNSKEMFRVLKEDKKPYDRDFYYKTVENPSILYRLQSSIERDDFDSFDVLILEHADELKLFFFCMLIFPLITSFRSALHSLLVDDNSEESVQKALAFFTSWSDYVARLEVFPESARHYLRKMKDLLANLLQIAADDDDDCLRQLTIAYLRFFAFMSSELKFDEKEKAIFDRVLYNPFFPDLYTNCLKEVEAEIEREKTKEELPDDQEQPEEDAALPEGQKTSKAGNKPKPWIKVSMNEDVIKKKLEEEVWFGIKDEIEALDYLGRSGAKRDTVKKSFGAAFMFYSAYSLGLTVEKQYSKSAERAFRFLPGPRTSVNEYLDKLHLWFTTLYEAQISRKGNIDRNTFKQWKSIDKFKAEFIIKNYIKLCPLFNNTKYLLGKALRIETGLELEGPGQSSDSVLGGAERYNDNVEIKNDGHHSKTALPLSYSNDD